MLQSRVLLGHERRELTIGAALGCPRSSGEWTVKEDRFKDCNPRPKLRVPRILVFQARAQKSCLSPPQAQLSELVRAQSRKMAACFENVPFICVVRVSPIVLLSPANAPLDGCYQLGVGRLRFGPGYQGQTARALHACSTAGCSPTSV